MKKKVLNGVFFLLYVCVTALSSCETKDDDAINTLARPDIDLKELGSGHDTPNDKMGYIGRDIHVEAEIVAEGSIEQIELVIKQTDGSYMFNKVYTDEQYVGKLNTVFHKHLDIPAESVEGNYQFYFIVTDKLGQSTEVKSELTLKDYGTDAPEPEVKEYEGVKLIVTYVHNNSIDLREPFSDRNDVLQASSVNSKISTDIRYFVANIALYSESHLDFVFTGLDLHFDHFHTYQPEVRSSIEAHLATETYWRMHTAASFQKGTGDIIYTGAENVLNGVSPVVIKGVSAPHEGMAVALGSQYFAVTDTETDEDTPSIIKVVKSDNTVVKQFTNYKKISGFANFRIDYIDQAVFATDKNLLTLNIGYSTDYKLIEGTIPNPMSFGEEPFDELHNVKDLTKTSVLGIKKNQGVYNIDLKTRQIDQLLSLTNIELVVFDFEDKFCYILTSDGILTAYNTNDFSKINDVRFRLKNGKIPRIVASRKFVYAAYEGDKSIMRFGVPDLIQYKSIHANDEISDIGLAGNLEEVMINNHK